MEISPWTVYWITRLDALKALTGVFAFVSAIVVVVAISIYWLDNHEISQSVKRLSQALICFAILCSIVNVFVPTTKQAIAMIGIPIIVNSDAGQRAQKLPDKFLEPIEQELNERVKNNNAK